jgi:hypothetical protein
MNKKTRFIINPDQAKGRRLPGSFLIVLWLLMDRLSAPEWLWGIYWFLVGVIAVIFLIDLFKVDEKIVSIETTLKDIWESEHQQNGLPKYKNPPPPPKTWEERIKEKMESKNG